MKTLHWTTTVAAAALAAACATATTPVPTALEAADGPVTFGGFSTPEAATYDAEHDRFLVGNVGGRGAPGQPDNDGFIVALNPDGTVQTLRWAAGSETVQLASPLGVEAANGVLYAADNPFVRRFDLETGAQLPSIEVPGAGILNDLDVAADGTIYITDMGTQDPSTWRVVKVSADGTVSTLVSGEVLGRPNGLDIGPDGRIYLAPVATANVVVVNRDGSIAETIPVPTMGNDGIIVRDGDILLSQPGTGTIYSIAPDGTATLLTDKTASGASIGYDTVRGVVIVPQLQRNAVSLYDIE
jgi:sugar lactone lactonase YvrE